MAFFFSLLVSKSRSYDEVKSDTCNARRNVCIRGYGVTSINLLKTVEFGNGKIRKIDMLFVELINFDF